MIQDKIRTEAFRQAIEKRSKDKIVVDVGAGTGILSIFAAASGALKVFAIENSGIVSTCKQNLQERALLDKIQVIHSLAEDAILPVE